MKDILFHTTIIYIYFTILLQRNSHYCFSFRSIALQLGLFIYTESMYYKQLKKRSEVIGFVSVSADTPGYYINSRHSNTAFSVNQDTL